MRFAQALLDRRLKIRWSSDLKVDEFFTPEKCELLYRSGMRSAAFGMESGSDRVLGFMQKGASRETLSQVNRHFHDAGVATQWMTFTGHPGETLEEALETVHWIQSESKYVDLFIVGEFGLEHGSDVALNPSRYGVDTIYYVQGDDLRLHALFTHVDGERSEGEKTDLEAAVRTAASKYALRPYPWAGAISTHHTLLHFLEFGSRVFRVHFQRAGAENDAPLGSPPPSHIAGLRERPRFSRNAIARREKSFFAKYLPEALAPISASSGAHEQEVVAPLCREHWRAATKAVEVLWPGKQ
jgi:hypothetical protein